MENERPREVKEVSKDQIAFDLKASTCPCRINGNACNLTNRFCVIEKCPFIFWQD